MRKNRKKESYITAAKKTKEERKAKQKADRRFASDKKGKWIRRFEKLLGMICMIVGLVSFLAMCVESSHYGTGHSLAHSFFICVIVFGGMLYYKACNDQKRMTRFRYYKSFLGEKEYIMLGEMESITGRPISFLQKDLSKMIRKKLLLQANMNREGTCLFLTKDSFRRYQRGQIILTAERENDSDEKERSGMNAKSVDDTLENERKVQTAFENNSDYYENDSNVSVNHPDSDNSGMDYEGYLYSINYRLTQIHDADMMKAASDICIRGQQLLYFKDTTMSKEVGLFLEYFLPLTDTILETYIELEKEGLKDQTADLKVNMNTIQHSFALFVEKLIEGKRVDVEEEISAVKMMLSD